MARPATITALGWMLWGPTAMAAPDLAMDHLNGPTSFTPGRPGQFFLSAVNQGDTTTDDLRLTLAASADQVFDGADAVLCTVDVPGGLAAGAGVLQAPACPYPLGVSEPWIVANVSLAPGATDVDADPSNDDVSYGPVTVQVGAGLADLRSDNLTVPLATWPGDVLAVSHAVTNTGTLVAPPTIVDIRLSDDPVFDATDDPLCTDWAFGIAAGQMFEARLHWCEVPDGLTPGSAWIVARHDATDLLLEPDEDDNTIATAIEILAPPGGADLTLESLATPTTSRQGDDLSLDWIVRNGGDDPSPAVDLVVRFSARFVYDPSEPVMCSTTVPALDAGAAASGTLQGCIVPTGIAVGSWGLVTHVDDARVLTEADERDNLIVRSMLVHPPARPNLRIILAGPLPQVPVDREFDLPFVIANDGDADAPRVAARVWLSDDTDIDRDDVMICEGPVPPMVPTDVLPREITGCRLPADTPPGTAILILRVDDDEDVAEVAESDNVQTLALDVLPAEEEPIEPTADTDTGLDTGTQRRPEPDGCTCAQGGGSGGWAVLLAGLAARRRRPRAACA